VIVSTTGGEQVTIPAARAAIAIGHLHFGAVGVFAAYSKNSVKDRLLLEPGEKDEAPAGLFPALRPGMTKDAEMLNGTYIIACMNVRVNLGNWKNKFSVKHTPRHPHIYSLAFFTFCNSQPAGRIAMLGLVALVTVSAATGQDILSVIDQGLGGLLLKA